MRRRTVRAEAKKEEKGTERRTFWAVVSYVLYREGKASRGGFYLDSIIPGTEDDARIEAEAAKAGADPAATLATSFVAPVSGALRVLTERGRKQKTARVWLLRRSVGGQREYRVVLVKTHVSEAEPEHGPEWQCVLLADGWSPPKK